MPRFYIKCSLVLGFIETCLFTFCEGQQYEIMPHYIKKTQTQPHIYNQEMYKLRGGRKSNTFDYNYEDWEDKKPDYYNFFMNTSDAMNTQTQTTQTANTTTTTPSTAMITSPTEDNKQQPTETTTTTTTATNTETPLKTEKFTSSAVTTVSTSTTSKIPEFPDQTEDIFQPTIVTVSTTTKPVRNPIVDEIIQVQKDTRAGYFTAGLILSLKKLADKKPEDLEPLLTGLNNEVLRLNSKGELMMFGYIVSQTLESMVRLASNSPVDTIQLQAKNGVSVLLNRRDEMSPDWNAIMDVADAIFIEDDLRRVANYLRDVQKYPNTTKAAGDIARDAIRALIIVPYERIEGTAKEKLLILEINNAVKHRLQEGIDTGRRLVGGAAEEAKLSKNKYMKDVEKFIFRTKTTERTSSTIFMEYARNATILATLKRKMKLYKEKFRLINKKERGSSKRGPTTTTTTTTTTTPQPPMHKSNYYIRKYVKKNLYKMTTTTKRTTVFKIRYYGKIRKFNIDSDTRSDSTYTEMSNGSDSAGYYSDTEYNNDNIQTDISFETKQSKHKHDNFKKDNEVAQFNPLFDDTKELNRFNTRTDPTRSDLDINNTNKHLNNIINKLTNKETEVAVVDDEDYLTANINNAVYHKGNFKTVNDRRSFITDLKDEYSVSDYEIDLKRNIYRAMNAM